MDDAEPKGKIAAEVPAALERELRALAKANDRSVSAEVRRALAAYLNRERGRT